MDFIVNHSGRSLYVYMQLMKYGSKITIILPDGYPKSACIIINSMAIAQNLIMWPVEEHVVSLPGHPIESNLTLVIMHRISANSPVWVQCEMQRSFMGFYS